MADKEEDLFNDSDNSLEDNDEVVDKQNDSDIGDNDTFADDDFYSPSNEVYTKTSEFPLVKVPSESILGNYEYIFY
jgi:hypothetical protein